MQVSHFFCFFSGRVLMGLVFFFQLALIQSVHAGSIPAYVIAEISISNHEAYAKEYRPLISKLYDSKLGGKFLSRGGPTVNITGEKTSHRVNLIEFESLAKAEAFYASEEYKKAIEIGRKYATFRINIIEGTPPK